MKKKKPGLTPEEERFCLHFASHKDSAKNALESYLFALGILEYSPKEKKEYEEKAFGLLCRADILEHIRSLERYAVNNTLVDNELAFLIVQRADFSVKMRAIAEYNKLNKRVEKSEDEEKDTFSLTALYDQVQEMEKNTLQFPKK